MEVNNTPSFDAPIPGQAMTAELGNRPWQAAPQFATVDDAMDYYMERMSSEEFMVQLVDVLEAGVPVTTLANTIQMGSVMDGIHSVDVGMLILPMLMEMIMMVGDSAGIKYDKGLEDPNKPKIRDSLFAKMISKYENKVNNTDMDKEVQEEEVEEQVETAQPSGLMARRS